MSRNLQLFKLAMAGAVCTAVITACSDRFGSYKSRRTSCVEYNDWARKNNKPAICQNTQPAGRVNNGGVDSTNNQLSRVPPTNGLDQKAPPKDAGTVTPPAAGNGPGDKMGSGAEEPTLPAGVTLNGPEFKDPYDKADWMKSFAAEIGQQNGSVPALLKGITVTSGADKGKTVFSIEGVVFFNQKYMFLTLVEPVANVKFDSKFVSKIKVQVKEKSDGVADPLLRDNIFVSATCLEAPASNQPCAKFGILIDFKVAKDEQTGKERVYAFLEVETGKTTDNGINAVRTNSSEILSFKAAYEKIPVTTPTIPIAGSGMTPGKKVEGQGSKFPSLPNLPGSEPTDADFKKGAQAAFAVVAEKNQLAIEQKRLTGLAKDSGKKDEAEAAATKAFDAGKAAMEAFKIIRDTLFCSVLSEPAKAEMQKMMDEAQVLADAAVKAGDEARELAAQTTQAATTGERPPQGAAPAVNGGGAMNTDPEGTADLITKEREAKEREAAEQR